jgi:hypothetical protein
VWQILKRLRINYKRGRLYLHSPDPAYDPKRSRIELKRLRVQYLPRREVLVYVDELTYYRQPTLAYDYECQGQPYPLARLSYQKNDYRRIIGALNAHTGQVTYRQADKIGVEVISQFFEHLCAVYPAANPLYVVLDNNPNHFHPNVLARLQPQDFPWGLRLPPTWPSAPDPAIPQLNLPIELLGLPTFASWLNPIEKLWRWLKQTVLHLHRYGDDWPGLMQRVAAFLDQFVHGSQELLRYVGLLPY